MVIESLYVVVKCVSCGSGEVVALYFALMTSLMLLLDTVTVTVTVTVALLK